MRALREAIASVTGLVLREQTGLYPTTTIDPDESLYRPVSGAQVRDLPLDQHRRAQAKAIRAFVRNPFAQRMVTLPRDYAVGEGLWPQIDDEPAQAWLDQFWREPTNDLPNLVDVLAIEAELLGEAVLPLFVRPDGSVRVTLVDPVLIQAVHTDEDNVRVPIGVEVRGSAMPEAIVLPTLLGPGVIDAVALGAKAVAQRETWRARMAERFGEGRAPAGVLYFSVNRIAGMSRGMPPLWASLDLAELLDRYQFDVAERAALINAFVWDVTLEGAQPSAITDWLKAHPTAPKPGATLVHNEKETWKPSTPDLKHADLATGFLTLRNYIAGNLGYSPNWLGDVDATRANAAESSELAIKTVTAKQRRLRHWLERLLGEVLWHGVQARHVPPLVGDPPVPVWQAVTIRMPDVATRDVSRGATALAQVTAAAVQAVTAGLLSRATAAEMMAAVSSHLGVECDPSAEMAAVEADQQTDQTTADRDLGEAIRLTYDGAIRRRRARRVVPA
jgi:hypothetical protein